MLSTNHIHPDERTDERTHTVIEHKGGHPGNVKWWQAYYTREEQLTELAKKVPATVLLAPPEHILKFKPSPVPQRLLMDITDIARISAEAQRQNPYYFERSIVMARQMGVDVRECFGVQGLHVGGW